MTTDPYLPLDFGITPPRDETGADLWFIVRARNILTVPGNGTPVFPQSADLEGLRPSLLHVRYLGTLRGVPCRAATLEEGAKLPDGFAFVELRTLLHRIREELFLMAGRALQMVSWRENHRFCGRCGAPTVEQGHERAMRCPSCDHLYFPRISPAVIVAIVREGTLLRALNARTKNNMRSVLAGYMEPGESFESCVKREVFEEVGLRVANIRYFASQPWPFPDALMVAFTADYAGGEIAVDGIEIAEAGWYSPAALPEILPGKNSVSGKLIAWFVERYSKPAGS
jgi:NAD+ diphosphatase